MAAIQDINISVSKASATVDRVGFGIPAIAGLTGQRSVYIHSSGASGLVLKSVNRQATLSIEITTGAYNYSLSSGVVTITAPATAKVRELVADFNANAPSAVTDVLSIESLTTGSGVVSTLTETELTYTEYRKIVALSQLDHYYDESDTEYEMIANILNSRPSPGQVYLIDVYRADYIEDISDILDDYDTGDWYLLLTTATTESEQQEIADYINLQNRLALFTSSDKDILGTVQGYRVAYLIHDAPSDHPEASWAAKNLSNTPGAATWKFTSNLQGQTVNTTTSLTDLLTIRENRGQSYIKNQGLSYVDEGRINDPDETVYIDQVWGRDWIEINLEADLLELFVNASAQGKKIPYTDEGIEQIKSVIRRRLTIAGVNGIIAPVETSEQAELSDDGAFRFRVDAPTRTEIEADNPSDIDNRTLNDVTFTFVEAGAVHEVTVTGRVVLAE